MPIKGRTQEAKFQRLFSLELHATQKRLERPEGEEGRRKWHRHAGRRSVNATGKEPGHSRFCEREGRIRPGSKSAQDGPGVLALERLQGGSSGEEI